LGGVIKTGDTMGGLSKGLSVIETFSADHVRQSISDVARRSGLDRSTARRCLLTLTQDGYASYDGKYFTLTPRVLRLGTACLAAMPLPRVVQPTLDALSEKLGESTSVAILDGTDIVYVARAAQRKVMSIGLMPGSRLPAYCTSMGRVLLASLPETEAAGRLAATQLVPRTKFTLTDPGVIGEELARVRAKGYAAIDQEVEEGLRSIAVAVVDHRGRVIAAINVGVAAGTVTMDELEDRFLPELVRTRDQLRALLI
jgi:IclR family transcriptional regulator, pca regulon regulatory protein